MSSPTETPNSKATASLTPRDIELLAVAMQSMKDVNVSYSHLVRDTAGPRLLLGDQ